jgi:hypothetical protein
MPEHVFDRAAVRALPLGRLTCLLALAAPSLACAANNVGWIFVDQANVGEGYTADAAHSFNSAGGSVKVGTAGTGEYQIIFSNLGISDIARSNVEVSALNSPSRCATRDPTTQGTTVIVYVTCYNAADLPTNSPFALIFQTRTTPFGSAGSGLAFLAQESITKNTSVYAFNSTGGASSAVKSSKTGIGAGNYTVTFGGFAQLGGNVQVNSYSSSDEYGGTAQCKVANWTGGSNITVQCYRNDNGNPNYSAFSLVYAIGTPFGVIPGRTMPGAWIWAKDPTSTASYHPVARYQFNGFKTGSITAQKTSTGQYTVTIPGKISYTSSVALVTATGPGNDYCNVAGWTGGTINVACYDHAENFADSRFNLVFQTAR